MVRRHVRRGARGLAVAPPHPVVGLVESGLDIVVFVLSAGMAYIRAASGEGEAVFTGRAVANLILSGTVLSASYMVARTRLAARPRRG